MAQSSKAAGKSKRKGKNVTVGVAPPPNSNISASAISVLHAAFNAENNPVVARQQLQEKNIHCRPRTTRA